MHTQHWLVILGALAGLAVWSRSGGGSAAAVATTPRPSSPSGLTVSEAEALDLIAANKLAYGNLSGIPASVVMATISNESSFRSNATAPAGEIGIMQIIYPGTWTDVIRRASLPADLDPWTPKDNILVGMQYLRLIRAELSRDGFLTGNSQTDWAMIDQAYNLGPAAVKSGRRNQSRLGKFLRELAKYQGAGIP